MKILFVTGGDDYAALQFKNQFKGVAVEVVEKDLEGFMEKFKEVNNDEDIDIWVKDLNVDEEALKVLTNFLSDSDDSKHSNIFWGKI